MQTKRSVIRNTALSYAGQAYTLLVGILIVRPTGLFGKTSVGKGKF